MRLDASENVPDGADHAKLAALDTEPPSVTVPLAQVVWSEPAMAVAVG